ncbi:hypothetical protein GQ55_3G099100 [Panicum hallii var. hallii]|uniref:Uncharacterized protein n=1 Tax=Panicum hallii var. hallii TaxID=1504633 RepID=A0A2T7E7N7_9POAL|nr:hypothetical protein GQ55_3G099100 [Panicum hallii var. hallii]
MAAGASVPIHPTLSNPSTTNQSRFAGRLLRQGPAGSARFAASDRCMRRRYPSPSSGQLGRDGASGWLRHAGVDGVAGLLQASICMTRTCVGNVNLII